MTDLLVLLDGNALMHRAFHAVPRLTSPRGELVNATYGFTSMLLKALGEYRPRYAVAAFDTAAPTFRDRAYAEYKAHRGPSPEGLHDQFRRVRQILEAFHIPVVAVEGYEADDVLGTLTAQATERGLDVLLVTADTDVLQLVGPHVRVLATRRGLSDTVLYDEATVRQRFGLSPSQLVDFKALRGDPTDNVPSVPGVGDATATQLLQQYGSVEGIYENLGLLPSRLGEVLERHRETVRRNRALVAIRRDAPVALDLRAAEVAAFDRQAVVAIFHELGFRSLLDRLDRLELGQARNDGARRSRGLFDEPEAQTATRSNGPAPVEVVTTRQQLEALARQLASSSRVGLGALGTSVEPMRADLVGLGLATEDGRRWYVPVGHRTEGSLVPDQLSPRDVIAALGPALRDGHRLAGHDLKYDLVLLGRLGLDLPAPTCDTFLAGHLVEGGRTVGLRDLAYSRLGREVPPAKAMLGEGRQARTMDQVPVQQAAEYAGLATATALELCPLLDGELKAQDLWRVYAEIELPLVEVLATMERHGVAVDVPYLRELSRELYERIRALEEEAYQHVGHRFNLNSPQQLSQVLFEELRLPRKKKTRTGHGSTGAEVLEELRGTHPIVDVILEHRQLTKLKSTYVDALPLLVHPETGRIHTSFNQAVTATGRLSSSNPNLQNIPIRTELGRRVRRAFVPGEPGWKIVAADYNQIEFRILAHITQEPRLLEVFREGRDLHTATAAEVAGIEPDEVTPEQRRLAKVVGYGVLYGMSEFGLSQRTELSPAEAATYINQYFQRYPRVRAYQEQVLEELAERGYVTTLLGRRRSIPEIHSPVRAVREQARRMAVNAPIQGTAADLIKLAMVRLHRRLREEGLQARMILQVHDELVFEAPEREVPTLVPAVREIMSTAMDLTVPLVVDVKVGDNWDEA